MSWVRTLLGLSGNRQESSIPPTQREMYVKAIEGHRKAWLAAKKTEQDYAGRGLANLAASARRAASEIEIEMKRLEDKVKGL